MERLISYSTKEKYILSGSNWEDVSNKSTQAIERKDLLSNNYQLQNNGSQNSSVVVHNRFSPIYVDKLEKAVKISSERFTSNNIIMSKSKNSNDQNKRPFPNANKFSERDVPPVRSQVSPGTSKSSEFVNFGRKTFIHRTSFVNGIRTNEFNSHLNKFSAGFRPFPGGTVRQMETYILSTFRDDKPDVAIVHVGCNDVRNGKLSYEEIARGIIQLENICKDHQVNNISSLVCRNGAHLNRKINSVKVIWEKLCQSNGFMFINNSNITEMDFADDGLHLKESGKYILTDNFIMRKLVLAIMGFKTKKN